MLKIKQKKLKAKNFRQLTDEIIQDPMVYLTGFFGGGQPVDQWLRDIGLTVNAAACPEMACADVLENGENCRQLIQHVEVAYILYKQAGLVKQADPLSFFRSQADYVAYSECGVYARGGGVDPADTLSKFFSYQSLRDWYATLDRLMYFLTRPKMTETDRSADRMLAARELLLRLGQAMHAIYERGGSPVSLLSPSVAAVE